VKLVAQGWVKVESAKGGVRAHSWRL